MSGYADELEEQGQNGRRIGRRAKTAVGAGVMVGALAAGVAIGLLTAPSEGRKTRRRLGRRLSGLADSPAGRLAALGSVGRRAGRTLRDRFGDISEGLSRRARSGRQLGEDALEELEDRIEALEERLEELDEEENEEAQDGMDAVVGSFESEGGGRVGRALGFALGAGLTYFLVSDRTAMARAKVQDAADKARRRATDEWDRFQREGGFQRFKNGLGGTSSRMERERRTTGAETSETPQQAM
jgi:gas vesicle protein